MRLEDIDDPLARFSFHASALSACRDGRREVRRSEPLIRYSTWQPKTINLKLLRGSLERLQSWLFFDS
jgi:hypothetical protein